MKYPTKFKKEVKELLTYFEGIAKLDFRGDILYKSEDIEGRLYDTKTSAETIINDEYYTADILIYPLTLKKWKEDPKSLRETISHEVSHIITEPLYNLIFQTYRSKGEVERIREQTTEKIARLMQKI